jgi:putative aminopeptidase FrvX
MNTRERLLKRLTEAWGPSGFESEVAGIMSEELAPVGRLSRDRLGCVIAVQEGRTKRGPRIMLAAHMDEVGFMVEQITKEGFLRFLPLGGWSPRVLPSMRVLIRTHKGTDVIGVVGIKPPHELSPEERKKPLELKDLHIDVGGGNKYDVKKELGIRVGDPIAPLTQFVTMTQKEMYLAKAWDDRSGCALVVEAMQELAGRKHPNTVIGVGTVQEEVGLRGAQTSGHAVKPDVAFAIDVALARDTPGYREDTDCRMGDGVAILAYDSTMIPNLALRDLAAEVAEEQEIPYQVTTLRGGYDTGRIHIQREGVPSLALGVPTRYAHSTESLIDRRDYESALKLIVALVERLDRRTVDTISVR